MKKILKNIMFLSALALSIGNVACTTDKGPDMDYTIQHGDKLYSPQNGEQVDLTRGQSMTFEWAAAVAADGGYITYDVLFDKVGGDFSNPIAVKPSQLTGSKTYLTIEPKDLNNIIKQVPGVQPGASGKVKWTVRASKGLFPIKYTVENELNIVRINSMDPLPTAVTLNGDALEDAAGIKMLTSAGIDGAPASLGTFECFTKITEGDFAIEDDLGRFYTFERKGSMKYHTESAKNTLEAGIYWLKLDFDVMTWVAKKVTKVEIYACAWVGGSMNTARAPFVYKGKGTWELLDYDNKNSTPIASGEKDSRHRFNMYFEDGSELFLGSYGQTLGTSYTPAYLKVNLITEAKLGGKDWGSTWNLLDVDCGKPFDCFLYMNGDNVSGSWYREYIFKK